MANLANLPLSVLEINCTLYATKAMELQLADAVANKAQIDQLNAMLEAAAVEIGKREPDTVKAEAVPSLPSKTSELGKDRKMAIEKVARVTRLYKAARANATPTLAAISHQTDAELDVLEDMDTTGPWDDKQSQTSPVNLNPNAHGRLRVKNDFSQFSTIASDKDADPRGSDEDVNIIGSVRVTQGQSAEHTATVPACTENSNGSDEDADIIGSVRVTLGPSAEHTATVPACTKNSNGSVEDAINSHGSDEDADIDKIAVSGGRTTPVKPPPSSEQIRPISPPKSEHRPVEPNTEPPDSPASTSPPSAPFSTAPTSPPTASATALPSPQTQPAPTSTTALTPPTAAPPAIALPGPGPRRSGRRRKPPDKLQLRPSSKFYK